MRHDDDHETRWEKNADGSLMASAPSEMEVRVGTNPNTPPHLVLRLRYHLPGNDPPEPAKGHLQIALGKQGALAVAEAILRELARLGDEPPLGRLH